MDSKDFERLLKNEAKEQRSEPPAFVWESIENDLKHKRKKRGFIWFFFGAFAIVLIGVVGYFSMTNNDGLVSSESTTLSKSSSKEVISNNELNSAENRTTSSSLNTSTLENSNNITDNKSQITLDSEVTSNHTNQIEIQATENKELKYSSNSNRSNLQSNIREIASSVESEHKKSNDIISLEDKNIKATSSNVVEESYLESQVSSIDLEEGRKDKVRIPSIDVVEAQVEFDARLLEFGFELPMRVVAEQKKMNRLTVSVMLGQPTFTNSLAPTRNSLAVTDWYSVGAGIGYSRKITDRLHIGTGINVRLSKRKLDYMSDLQLVEVNDSAYFKRYQMINSLGEQRFVFLDIPLSVDYKLIEGKFDVVIGAEALLNIGFMTSGKAISNEGEIIRYTTADKIFTSSLRFGVSPNIGISYPVSRDVSLSAGLHYLWYFGKIESTTISSDLQHQNVGIDFGVSRRF